MRNLNISFITKSIDVISYAKDRIKQTGGGKELRYGSFEDVALETSANKIALAHNADDQTETFFMRILRGRGKGLSESACEKTGSRSPWRPAGAGSQSGDPQETRIGKSGVEVYR